MENQTQIPSGPKGPFSENWLVESILVTFFCCLPLGIVGLIYSSQVNSKMQSGDRAGAEAARADAAKWTKIGFWSGVAVIVLYILFWVVLGASLLGSMM